MWLEKIRGTWGQSRQDIPLQKNNNKKKTKHNKTKQKGHPINLKQKLMHVGKHIFPSRLNMEWTLITMKTINIHDKRTQKQSDEKKDNIATQTRMQHPNFEII